MKVLDFENDNFSIKFEPKPTKATTYQVKIYAKDLTNNTAKKLVFTTQEYKLYNLTQWHLTVDYTFYIASAKKIATKDKFLPTQIEFSFGILIEKNESAVSDVLKVHFIRYIPQFMKKRGWTNGEKLQRIWFTKGNNTNRKSVPPEIDVIDWTWVMSESKEAKEEYEEFFSYTVYKLRVDASNVQKSLKNEISNMIKEGYATMPTAANPETSFGTFSKNMTTFKGEPVPYFEKYYYHSKDFSGIWDVGKHYNREGVDDLIAALANFNFHVAAKGKLKYEKGGWLSGPYTQVQVTELAFYVKDSFDFIDDDPNKSQPLGYWKIENNTVTVEIDAPSPRNQYFQVTNASYRAYRSDHTKGYDFYLYSTLNKQPVNVEFRW